MDPRRLDSAVVDLLKANRKIAAIKLLRENENLGLKEAKQAVDSYLTGHPSIELAPNRRSNPSRSPSTLMFFITVACVCYLGYDYLA